MGLEQETYRDTKIEHEPNPVETVLVLDVDSTISWLEGIDELARMHGVFDDVAALTKRAMNGEIPFDDVFGLRLAMIGPLKDDLIRVGEQYLEHITPYAKETIALLRGHGVVIHLVSGGYREAILPAARYLGIDEGNVWANDLEFHDDGTYKGYDEANPLCHNGGKARVLGEIKNKYPDAKIIAMVGDSVPDMRDSKGIANLRIAFGGHVMRPGIEHEPDILMEECSLAALAPILLSQERIAQSLTEQSLRQFMIRALGDLEGIITRGGANGWTDTLICKVRPLVVS